MNTLYEFVEFMCGPYQPVVDELGVVSINWQYMTSLIILILIVFSVVWWTMHMVFNFICGRRR